MSHLQTSEQAILQLARKHPLLRARDLARAAGEPSRAVEGRSRGPQCRFFGLSDGWWLRLQADYDTEVAKASLAKTLAKIRPWKEAAEQTVDAH